VFAVSVLEGTAAENPLVISSSTNLGQSWATNQIATGKDNLIPCYGYPSAAFDSYGNLYVAYLPATFEGVAIAISTNLGATFTALTNLVAADATETPRLTAGPDGSVWVVYKDYSLPSSPLVAQGLLATNLSTNSQFGPPLLVPTSASGGFPDIAVGPAGQVMIGFQNNLTNSGNSKIFVTVNTNAFGTNGFSAPIAVATDAAGGLTYIPAQPTGIGLSANVGVAWDVDPYSHFFGRAYVIYSALDTKTNLFIALRHSANNGATWSSEVTVNDDTTGNSHFMPRVAVDPVTGLVACSWYDCRNDLGNNSVQQVVTASSSITFNSLQVTNLVVTSNGISNPTLDIQTNSASSTEYDITISGNNLQGTIISNNATNIVYIVALKPYITFEFEGLMGTNASGMTTTVNVTLTDTLPDAFTSGDGNPNEEAIVYTTISTNGGANFEPNESSLVADQNLDPNSSVKPPVFGFGSLSVPSDSALGFGNYTALAFYSAQFYPGWPDNSDAGLQNPNGPLTDFDVLISPVFIPNSDLAISVSNSPNPVLSDGVIAYYIEAINNGPVASVCVVTDVLPSNVTFESAVPALGGSYSIKGQDLVFTIPTLLPHTSATNLVLVTAGTSGYGTNFAIISGPLVDAAPANNTNILVTLFDGEDLALGISSSATNVYGGQVVTNVVTITNLGPSANGDVMVSSRFKSDWGELTVLSAGWSLAPTAVSPGTYSTNNNILVLNVGTLSSNQTTNILVAATALATFRSGFLLFSVSSADFDPNPNNNSASIAVAMTAETIGAGITAGPAQVGKPETFTIVVTNFGPSPDGFITVSDFVPPNFSAISVVQSPNLPTINGNVITFPIGAVPVDGTATVVFTAIPLSVATVTNSMVASSFDYAPSVTQSVLITPAPAPSAIEAFQVIPASSGAFLVWDTPISATVQVDYGLTATYGSASSVSGPSTHHVVLLTGLMRDTNYYFDALSWENGILYVTNGIFSTIGTLILNTPDADYVGLWTASSVGTGILGTYYQSADTTVSEPTAAATYTPLIPSAGKYDVSIWYPQSPIFATNTPVNISGATNRVAVSVNQTINGGSWQTLALDVYFAAGLNGNVAVYNNTGVTNKGVAANGMRWDYDVTQDSATNGVVPGWWSSFYFGTNIVSGSADSDGDGYSNYAEYIFGTDPTDPTSYLNFSVTPLPGGMATVKFSPYQGGRIYQLLSNTNLLNPQWLTLTNVATQDTNGNGVFTVTETNPKATYYRLSATLAP